jgi:HPr kinase/phosphorylase
LLDNTRYLLSQALAENTNEHGVFIEVYSIGVFITGKTAIGKSELALSLISRGHRLISDDVTLFSRSTPDRVEGRSPQLLTDFLEVRGLGVVNVRAMFGANALTRSMPLSLIVNMVELDRANKTEFDRLGNNLKMRTILGLEFPEVSLPVAQGRNLAVLVEAATRNHLLQINIVSGLSGSGKTVALHTLEDAGYYCIDNLPLGMLPELVDNMINATPEPYDLVAIAIDARSGVDNSDRFDVINCSLKFCS